MVEACSRKCKTGNCGKKLSFGVANPRSAEYCAQHARLQYGVEEYRKREVKTIGYVISSGATMIIFRPPPTETTFRPASDLSRDSRKRVRHPETTSTASMRAVSPKSAGGAVTVPDIDRQKSPVKRNSYIKKEVHISL